MKVGIEEEFIVVDPETLFCSPSAFRIATHFVYKNFENIYKCSVELPLSSRSLDFIFKNIKKAFTVFEIKTNPYEDIDTLHDELLSFRKTIAGIADDNHLMLLPTGIHPMYSTSNSISDNCAALQVHADYTKNVFDRLYAHIPFLISISTNSPFINGEKQAMSNRLHYSPHVGIPSETYTRSSDIIHNKFLDTVEVRVFDAQITVDETIGLASIVKCIAEQDLFDKTISKKEYQRQREKAVKLGFNTDFISKEAIDTLKSYNKYAKKKLETTNGSEWQSDIFKEHNLSSVITSLWESFKLDKQIIKTSNKEIKTDQIKARDLLYGISYAPFFFVDKARKCLRDKSGTIELVKSLVNIN